MNTNWLTNALLHNNWNSLCFGTNIPKCTWYRMSWLVQFIIPTWPLKHVLTQLIQPWSTLYMCFRQLLVVGELLACIILRGNLLCPSYVWKWPSPDMKIITAVIEDLCLFTIHPSTCPPYTDEVSAAIFVFIFLWRCWRPSCCWTLRYEECKEKLVPFLKKVGFNPKKDIHFMPCSGLTGANLKEPTDMCSWYT